MLDPPGKLSFSKVRAATRHDPHHFAYGFYKGRRREQAILVHHAVASRLRQAAKGAREAEKSNYSHVVTMRDISNVFPSVKSEALDEAIRKGASEKAA